MRQYLVKLILCCCVLLQIACNNCNRVECEPPGGTIKLRLLKNGQNAVFGPDAYISKDSITFLVLDPSIQSYQVGFSETTQTINFWADHNQKYVMEIKNIRTDTLIALAVETSRSECCVGHTLTNVKLNGQNICQDNCEDIIEIAL